MECTIQSNLIGYYKVLDDNFNENYIKCDGNLCEKMEMNQLEVTEDLCNIGDLVINDSQVKICIDYSKMVKFSDCSTVSSQLLMKNSQTTIFGTKKNGDYLMISISDNSIIPTDLSNGKN